MAANQMSGKIVERFVPILSAPIELGRVRLRAVTESDVDACFAIFADPETARYLSRPPWTERAQAEQFVERVRANYGTGNAISLAVARKEDDQVIGECVLFGFNAQCRRAEIGYSLARPCWSQGYMHEALTGFIDIAFGALDLNRLEADIDPRNAPSARILERLGFVKEGYLRERWIVAGEKSDTALFGLLRSDWALLARLPAALHEIDGSLTSAARRRTT
jgi:RimJ/RimL family protein N-acetyltransferase